MAETENMTIDLRPICEKGQRVTAGQILTEGYSTEDGELALGDADAAIMLSASHNPYEFNGIKIFGADGFTLTDEEEEEIEAIVLDHAME